MRNMRCVTLLAAFCAMAALLSGCGPGLLALAGGTSGGILGFGGKKDGGGGGGGGTTNTPPAVVVTSLTREDAPATISYTLIDAEQNLCSVNVAYSLDGVNFFGCTQGTGGDATNFLNSSSGGTNHTFEWDYELDLLTQGLVSNVTIAITASDAAATGQPGTLGNLRVGNDAPEIIDTPLAQAPQSLVSGNLVLVTFNIKDTSGDIAGLEVAYTIDLGQTFVPLDPTPVTGDFVGTAPTSLLTTPTGAAGQFIWDSSVALPSFVGNNVYLVLIPVDKPPGWTTFTTGTIVPVGPLSLNNINNGPPVIELISDLNGTSQVGTVNVQFTLTDTGSDSAAVALEYSVGGGPFAPARLVGQATAQDAGPFVCTPSPRLYSLTWDALADLGATGVSDVELRLTPAEFGATSIVGTPVLSGTFTLTPNEAPEVTDFQVYQNAGNITVRVQLSDSSAENVSLDITARWNSGASSFVLSSADFVSGDISNCLSSTVGEDNLLIWNTKASGSPFALINAADVFWEITPTDIPVSSPTAAMVGTTFTSGTFSVVNDLSGTTPIAINLTEDSGAVTVPVAGARNFTALIQPQSALDHTVTWDIVEGASYGLIVPASSPLQGPQTALYAAPVILPMPNQGYVTVRCTSTVAPTVSATYRLYFGSVPTSVLVTPPAPDIVLGASQQFSASVSPGAAPQLVTWQVIGGSTNGTIDNTGLYSAPIVMPVGGHFVTVRATSVKSTVFGEAVVNLQPLPSSCLVTSQGGASTGPSQLTLGQTLQLAATITPPEAPQSVFWTIDWNGVGQGTGNPTVGTVTSTGLYSAPSTLPAPSQIFVRARSQVASSVTDTYQIDLIAPPPTSFSVTPSSVTLSAGGAGVDFDVINFVPSNANKSVNWSMNPVFGLLDSQTGVYTPPPNSSTTTVVVVTATSTVAGSVFASANVTVQPNAAVAPQTLVISPHGGRTFTAGRALQFAASVLPSGAPQTVNWAVISGTGSINATGVYSPPSTPAALDTTCTIRCTSSIDNAVFDTITVDLDGAGDPAALSIGNVAMGRSEPVAFYDTSFDRIFYCGGYSENDFNKHDDVVFMHDISTNTWKMLGRMNPSQSTNTIAWAYDTSGKFIYAFVGNGGAAVGVYRLNVSLVTPTWAAVSVSGSDVPILSGNFRYMSMYDESNKEIYVSVSAASNTIYRLDVSNSSNLSWKTKKTGVVASGGTPQTEKCAYIYDTARQHHTIIGTAVSTGSSTKVWFLNNSGGTWFWSEISTTGGGGPAGGYDDASATYEPGGQFAITFGGRPGLGLFSNNLYQLNMITVPFVWTPISISIAARSPQQRGRAAMILVGGETYIFGGKNAAGIFGDLWHYDSSNGWGQPAPDDMFPQGRKLAAATWVDTEGAGWMFGGICDYGVSDEMWRLEYNAGKAAWNWFLENPATFSTSLPGSLTGATLSWDPTADRLLLFAGGSSVSVSVGLTNKMYSYNPSNHAWGQLTPTGGPPPARLGHTSCYNPTAKEMIYFGGQDGPTSYRNDVWMYNVQINAWTAPAISGTIEGRAGSFAGYQPTDNKMFVLGGATQTSGGVLQLYELQFTSLYVGVWNALPTHQFGSPKGIFPGAGVYDLAGERFLCAPPGQIENQALVYCHPVQGANPPITWQILNPGSVTHGIGAFGMYDGVNSRFIAIGGENDVGGGKFRKLNQIRVVKLK